MNCDPLARSYRWLEYAGFGRALERRRQAFLPLLTTAQSVLMLGEGDGRFLAAFLRCNPLAKVDYVDSSGKMLELARARARMASSGLDGQPARVRFHHADVCLWLLSDKPRSYDLICTHFFLDCFNTAQLGSLVERISPYLGENARWILSDFQYPQGRFAALPGRLFITLLYRFFGIFTALAVRRLPDHESALQNVGFRRRERLTAVGGLLVSERWERV